MRGIHKMLLAELTACLIFTLIAGCFAGLAGAKSAVFAGLAYLIPNAYRTYRAFRHKGARAARLILKGFYQGEMVKFALSVVVFAYVFSQCTINPVVFLGTYIGMQMLIWFAPLLIKMN